VSPSSVKIEGDVRIETLSATNTTELACVMTGYPSVAPYRAQAGFGGSSSAQAVVAPIPTEAGPIGAAARPVTLGPGQAAVFFLMWSVEGKACEDAAGVTFDTPVSSTLAPVPFPFRFCDNSIKQSVILPAGTTA